MQNDWNEKKKEEEEIGTKFVFNRASISRVSINNPLIDRTSIYPTVFILKKKSIAIFLFLSLSLSYSTSKFVRGQRKGKARHLISPINYST